MEVFGKGWPGLPQQPPQDILGGEAHHIRGIKESGAMNVEGGSIARGKIPRETGGARSNPSAEGAVITPASSPSDGAREAIASAHAQGGKGIKQSDGRTGASQPEPNLRSKNHRSQPWQRTTTARGRKLQMTQAANGMSKTGGDLNTSRPRTKAAPSG